MPQKRDPALEAEWEAKLAAEGLPPEPPVKRLRRTRSDERQRGSDPQPRREVSYSDWSPAAAAWSLLSDIPESDLEAAMMALPHQEIESKESQWLRVQKIWQALEWEGEVYVTTAELLADGANITTVASHLGTSVNEAKKVVEHVRYTVRRTVEGLPGGGSGPRPRGEE